MEKEIIGFDRLTKEYGNKCILKDVDYSFDVGVSTAFVGYNGCGKSTILKMIAGLVEPSKGKVRRNMSTTFAYIPEKFEPVPLTALSYLTNMGKLDGIKGLKLKNRILQLAEEFFVKDMLNVPLKYLSKGTLQKIGVMQALLVKKDILVLDEPLSGQDEASQTVFVNHINKLKKENITIFMSCHEQWLVEAVSDQVLTIQNEKIVPYKRGMYDENSKFSKISTSDIF